MDTPHGSALPYSIRGRLSGFSVERVTVGQSRAAVYRYYAQPDVFYLKTEHKDGELVKERAALEWLGGRLPVPRLVAWDTDEALDYLLMSAAKGRALNDGYYMKNPCEAVSVLAGGIRLLHSAGTNGCPLRNDLSVKLKDACANVSAGLVDMSNWEPETDFGSPGELLLWLEQNRPPESLVFSHGDYCFENIFGEGGNISGFIDLGRSGAADIWQDVAMALRSLWHNFGTREYDSEFLRQIGVPMDEQKLKYYILLDELF